MTEAFKTTISSTVSRINEAKNKTYYFSEIVPYIDGQITTQIPNMGIVGALLAAPIDNENELQILKERFEKLKKTCHELETGINNYQREISKILQATSRARQIFENFGSILRFLSDFIPIIKNLIRIAKAVIALQVSVPVAGGTVSGTLILKQNDIINAALSKIKEIEALTKIFDSLFNFIEEITEEIDETLIPIQSKLTEIETILNRICRNSKYFILC